MFLKRLSGSCCSTRPPVLGIKGVGVILTVLFTLSIVSATPSLISQAAPLSPAPTPAANNLAISAVTTLPTATTAPTFALARSGSDHGSAIAAHDARVRESTDGFQIFLPLASKHATTPPPTSASPPITTPDAGWEDEIIAMTNQERADHGLPPLLKDDRLMIAAEGHSLDMALNDFFGHTGSDGSLPWDRGSRQGYNWCAYGENIAAGEGLCSEQDRSIVMDTWMNSPAHRDNILNPDYEDIGVGFVYDPQSTYGCYWTMNLGTELD